jgi:hypothetical protein
MTAPVSKLISTLMIQATARRQLGDGGLFRIQDGEGATGEAFAGFVQGCGNPECDCREVGVTIVPATPEPAALVLAESAGKIRLEVLYPPGTIPGPGPWKSTEFRIDVDSGEVKRATRPGSAAPLARFRRQLDGELLDWLHDRLVLIKGLVPNRQVFRSEARSFDLDRDLTFGFFHENTRREILVSDDQRYEVQDLYCADPECHCGHATLAFFREFNGRLGNQLGSVELSLGDPGNRTGPIQGVVEGFAPETGTDPGVLRGLFGLYAARDPSPARLFRRREGVRTAAQEHLTCAKAGAPKSFRAPSRPGRNDACPCGSGKKFKKCCLQSAQGQG